MNRKIYTMHFLEINKKLGIVFFDTQFFIKKFLYINDNTADSCFNGKLGAALTAGFFKHIMYMIFNRAF